MHMQTQHKLTIEQFWRDEDQEARKLAALARQGWIEMQCIIRRIQLIAVVCIGMALLAWAVMQ